LVNKLKILTSFYQIASSLPSTLQIQFPSVYGNFSGTIARIFNVEAFHLMSIGCLYQGNFHSNLLMTTISPLLLAALLFLVTQIQCAAISDNGAKQALKSSRFSTFLGLSYLVFASASTMAFTTFLCTQYGDDETYYLIADRSIDYNSKTHEAYEKYAFAMIAVYPIGTTSMYYLLLRRHKKALLKEGDEREDDASIQHLAFL